MVQEATTMARKATVPPPGQPISTSPRGAVRPAGASSDFAPTPETAVAGAATATAAPSVLAGAASYELRSTLALISGYSQSLLHLALDEDTRRHYLERMSHAADNLGRLADEILEISAAGAADHS